MKPEIIYESSESSIENIEWKRTGENEWINLDLQPSERSVQDILKYFTESKVYVAVSETDSQEIQKAYLPVLLKRLHGEKDFKVWSRNFRYVIELNAIGKYRKGEVKENKSEFFLARLLQFFVEHVASR